jgi:hypothetical protein
MPDEKVLQRLGEIATRPMAGEPGYECPNHPPSHRCVSCITDEEWEGIPAHPCGCLTWGEECPECWTEPGKSRGPGVDAGETT